MNTIEIKGIVPGAGKTTTLVLAFVKTHLKNKIILTPSNKARQNIQQMLTQLGHKNLADNVMTLRRFKHNFVKGQNLKRYFDLENQEEVILNASEAYFTIHSKPHYKKVWNIFIDEASMISKEEIDDLVKNWKIQNLILCGDSLQFDPIGNSQIVEIADYEKYEWLDEGKPYDLKINHQLLLNKSMRARDEKLRKAIEFIKNGDLLSAFQLFGRPKEVEKLYNDWHIAYTNKRCQIINELYYKNPKKWIVTHNDNIHGFATSEILEDDNPRLVQLEKDLFYESSKNDKVPTFEEWKANYLKPAYALTCHKLQGTTIEEGNIYIDLSDIICSIILDNFMSLEQKALLLQKFLYIAVSRAVDSKQINILVNYGLTKKGKEFSHDIYDVIINDRDGYFKEITDTLAELLERIKPMEDNSIWENPDFIGAANEGAVEALLSMIDYEAKAEKLEGEDNYKAKVSKTLSIAHKKSLPPFYYELILAGVGQNEFIRITSTSTSVYRRIKEELGITITKANTKANTKAKIETKEGFEKLVVSAEEYEKPKPPKKGEEGYSNFRVTDTDWDSMILWFEYDWKGVTYHGCSDTVNDIIWDEFFVPKRVVNIAQRKVDKFLYGE